VFRSSVAWRKLETSKGVYNSGQLAWLDGNIALAEARGMVPVFNVVGTPCWAITDGKPCTYWTPPGNVVDPERFERLLSGPVSCRRLGAACCRRLARPALKARVPVPWRWQPQRQSAPLRRWACGQSPRIAGDGPWIR
jgi:hypothetical protein